MFAYIPARKGSKRIPGKNTKLLGGVPLIIHVINNLKLVSGLKGIAVSTDCSETLALVRDIDSVVTLGLRSLSLSDDDATFTDLIDNDLSRFIKHFNTENILFTTATAALVNPSSFEQGIQSYKNTGLVMSVVGYNHPPFLALEEKVTGELLPLFPKSYLKPTKDLATCYVDCGCFYIFNSTEFGKKEKLIDLSPILPVKLSDKEGIDLDTPEDWKKLENIFNEL
jgi:N-acylneuraminate cytidylyltransferase